ncbi:unnamed protein product [Coffea canephora]|uniref:Uncharacterized protein n=1 Tax=Coffea canephora TaxID=49390 RepID=A0A068UX09_COFCA|nr:unnamed protein product [Coffea canephora]
MGNCIETCKHGSKEAKSELQLEQLESVEKPSEMLKESIIEKDQNSGAMRIKIVLTKEELELLVFQLKNMEGKRLEDVLDEIERGRSRPVGSWKPSLESITESPEVPEQMDR